MIRGKWDGGAEFKLYFSYRGDAGPFMDAEGTTAHLDISFPDGAWEEWKAEVVRHVDDPPNRPLARREALKGLLYGERGCSPFTREQRRAAWEAYRSRGAGRGEVKGA